MKKDRRTLIRFQKLPDYMIPKFGDTRALARTISLVENEAPGYEKLLEELPHTSVPVIGITGPPGAGKSTLTDALIGECVKAGKKVAVLCVDPLFSFQYGRAARRPHPHERVVHASPCIYPLAGYTWFIGGTAPAHYRNYRTAETPPNSIISLSRQWVLVKARWRLRVLPTLLS